MCSIEKRPFGSGVVLYTLKNSSHFSVDITNYGGIIVAIRSKDKEGKIGDVVLGYDNLGDYKAGTSFMGAIIGRVTNRIANGRFSVSGQEYIVEKNNGNNSLHGGAMGFNKIVWNVKGYSATADKAVLVLHHLSEDGESGYPGNLSVQATYTLTLDNEIRLDFSATTDQDTVVNLTNHTYFNLTCAQRDISDHVVTIHADKYIPINEELIPTGEIENVEGTPMDFRTPKKIGERIDSDFKQLKLAKGYDHTWVLSKYKKGAGTLFLAVTAYDPSSGRIVEVYTTQPGVQFYSGNFLNGASGKNGKSYPFRYGFCLETQHFPDAVNQPKFESVLLKEGENYNQSIVYKFSVLKESKL